jgi:hypothetical protein
METRKWITRIGSLLVLIGFFLPSVLVSCSGLSALTGGPSVGQSLSLSDLANSPFAKEGILYLVPILLLATLVLTFMSGSSQIQNKNYIWGQVACIVISFVVILITALNLSGQFNNLGGAIEVKPDIGALVILIGYVAAVVGLAGQMSSSGSAAPLFNKPPAWNPPAAAYSPPAPAPVYNPPPAYPPAHAVSYHLELISGKVDQTYIPLQKDNLLIGRGADCDVQLSNPTISRQHVRLRFANDAWFIQDQGSSAGTQVNGKAVSASRLNPGDTISMGDVTFAFKV